MILRVFSWPRIEGCFTRSRKKDSSVFGASTGNVSVPKDAVVAYLPQHLLTTDGATVMEEASKAFGEIFKMKAEIDEINEQLTIRTD